MAYYRHKKLLQPKDPTHHLPQEEIKREITYEKWREVESFFSLFQFPNLRHSFFGSNKSLFVTYGESSLVSAGGKKREGEKSIQELSS